MKAVTLITQDQPGFPGTVNKEFHMESVLHRWLENCVSEFKDLTGTWCWGTKWSLGSIHSQLLILDCVTAGGTEVQVSLNALQKGSNPSCPHHPLPVICSATWWTLAVPTLVLSISLQKSTLAEKFPAQWRGAPENHQGNWEWEKVLISNLWSRN